LILYHYLQVFYLLIMPSLTIIKADISLPNKGWISEKKKTIKQIVRERSMIEEKAINEKAQKFIDHITENISSYHARGVTETTFTAESPKIASLAIQMLVKDEIRARYNETQNSTTSDGYQVIIDLTSLNEDHNETK